MASTREVLFIHGGGDDGYGADAKLVASLEQHLGATYSIRYPSMPDDPALPDFGWGRKISNEIAAIEGDLVLVGHSLGASALLQWLAAHPAPDRLLGVFLLATPFWSGDEDWVQGLKLRDGFANALPRNVPTFFYRCDDDEEVDDSHLQIYAREVPWATIRRQPAGGHQFGEDLALVARDIRTLG